MPGRLVLVPAPLDFGCGAEAALDAVLPREVIGRAAGIAHWAVENAKSARAFLKRVDAIVPLARPLQAIEIHELPRPRKGGATVVAPDHAPLLAPMLAGHDLGLLAEAGMPAVADPGAALVAAAHVAGIAVLPLVGPSALLLALAASGLEGQRFAFVGYLPIDDAERAERIRALDAHSRRERQTQIAIETPYRNLALLRALVDHLHPATRLSLALGLTLPDQRCITRNVREWRSAQLPALDRVPAVFLFLAG